MSQKLKNTRVVVFKEDYNPTGRQILYRAGEKNYLHASVVETLQNIKGLKMDVSEFPREKEIEKAKEEFQKQK